MGLESAPIQDKYKLYTLEDGIIYPRFLRENIAKKEIRGFRQENRIKIGKVYTISVHEDGKISISPQETKAEGEIIASYLLSTLKQFENIYLKFHDNYSDFSSYLDSNPSTVAPNQSEIELVEVYSVDVYSDGSINAIKLNTRQFIEKCFKS